MEGESRKRKLGLGEINNSSRKKSKRNSSQIFASHEHKEHTSLRSVTTSADDLPWKPVHQHGISEVGGEMLMLEEVEGVEVVYDDDEDGSHLVQFRIAEPKVLKDAVEETSGGTAGGRTLPRVPATPIPIEPFDSTLLPSWAPFPLHPILLQSIHHRGFQVPTEIQKRTLGIFLNNNHATSNDVDPSDRYPDPKRRDIIGIAETGSGKTLAYGLPILHTLLNLLSKNSESSSQLIVATPSVERRALQALVLAPTRELALQVSQHLGACLDRLYSNQRKEGQQPSANHPPPPLSVAAIVGGMSSQKQRRILSRGVDVLVATPGRLWDICGEDPALATQLCSLRFLVIDEADRMIEAGHFQELDNIFRLTSRPLLDNSTVTAEQDPPRPDDLAYADMEVPEKNDTLQTFVFSATMSKDLQRNLKNRKRKRDTASNSTLDDLLTRLDFRDPEPVIIDLSPEGGRVEGLQESKVECLVNDKDAYLYYFLLRHPGRSLVFLSSKDGIRRLVPLLELLKLNVWPLHSSLQQKQRLKNLDRFKSVPNSVLLATDVAARGLDVPAVDHVIHYQVPRSADAYVHRNGRTARAMQKGFGLVLCAPDERRVFRDVLAQLKRDEDDIPELHVEHHLVDKLKGRVQLARQIDAMTHRSKKDAHEKNWMRDTADAMEVELPSELESDVSDGGSRKKAENEKVKVLKTRLTEALAQPLISKGISKRYITSGSRQFVDDVLEGESHETFLGLKRMQAGSEVVRPKKQKRKIAAKETID